MKKLLVLISILFFACGDEIKLPEVKPPVQPVEVEPIETPEPIVKPVKEPRVPKEEPKVEPIEEKEEETPVVEEVVEETIEEPVVEVEPVIEPVIEEKAPIEPVEEDQPKEEPEVVEQVVETPIAEPFPVVEPEPIETPISEPTPEPVVEEPKKPDCSGIVPSFRVGEKWTTGRIDIDIVEGELLTIGLESGDYSIKAPWNYTHSGAWAMGRVALNYSGVYTITDNKGCEVKLSLKVAPKPEPEVVAKVDEFKELTQTIILKDPNDVNLSLDAFMKKYGLTDKEGQKTVEIKIGNKIIK